MYENFEPKVEPEIEPAEEKSPFEEQWEKPETIRMGDEEIRVFDIQPEQITHERPVVYLLGFGATPKMVKHRMKILSGTGRRVLLIHTGHGIDHEIETDEQLSLPDAQLRKVAAVMEVLDHKNVACADINGNSEGGMVGVMAATLYPERFYNLSLEQPAGIIGKDNILRLAIKFPLDVVKSSIEAMRDPALHNVPQQTPGKDEPKTPLDLKRAFAEVRGMADTQIDGMLKNLKETGHGIVIVHGADDNVFPMDRVQKMIQENMVDGFYSVKGTHAQIRTEKDLEAYTKITDQALTALEEKEVKENEKKI